MGTESHRNDSPRPRRRATSGRRGRNPVVLAAVIGGGIVILAVSVWPGVYFLKSRPGDARLIGTWKSDADATIAEMRKNRPVAEQQEQALRKIFGRVKVTYTATTLTSDFDGVVETQPYQVVRKDRDSVVIKTRSPISKAEEEFTIRFADSDTYWIAAGQIMECLRRMR